MQWLSPAESRPSRASYKGRWRVRDGDAPWEAVMRGFDQDVGAGEGRWCRRNFRYVGLYETSVRALSALGF